MTLVELLVALALTVFLVALAFSLVGTVGRGAKEMGCVSNLRQLGVASLNYAVEHEGILPRADQIMAGTTNHYIQWPYVIEPYLGVNYLQLLADGERFRRSPFACPAEQEPAPTYHYAMNRQLNERISGAASLIRLAQVRNPSRYVLFSDSYYDRTIFTDLRSKMITMTRMTRRHQGIPTFLYADGHAAPYRGPLYGVSDAEGKHDPEIRALWEYNYPLPSSL